MKKLEPLFGFECSLEEDGLVSIVVNCIFPQEKKNCLKFYKRLEEHKIIESKIVFPIKLKHTVVTVNATNEFTIMNYFKIDGIKKIVEENKSKLLGKKTFIKPELQYNKKCKYPNLHIHFYQVSEEGVEIINIEDMIEFCHIHYENTKQFTSKRLSDLEHYVNTLEIREMPFLPIEEVKFNDNNEIQDFENYLLVLKGIKPSF